MNRRWALVTVPESDAKCRPLRQIGSNALTLVDAGSACFGVAVGAARRALRLPGREPLFFFAAVATLVVAATSNSLALSVVDALLLRQLPYPSPTQLVAVGTASTTSGGEPGYLSTPAIATWSRDSQAADAVAAYSDALRTLRGRGPASQLSTAEVTPSLFDVLRVAPQRGRAFAAQDARAGAPGVAILSHRLWREQFGGDDRVLGRSISLDDRLFTVVGVMPAGFSFPKAATQLWVPRDVTSLTSDAVAGGTTEYLKVVARLRGGTNPAEAVQEIQRAIARSVAAPGQVADSTLPRARVTPLREAMTANLREALIALALLTALVLVVACLNVATLMLTRYAHRYRELAVRMALGATRSTIVLELTVESLALAASAAVVSLLLLVPCVKLLPLALPLEFPRVEEIRLSARMLGITFASTIGTCVLCCLVAAIQAARSTYHVSLTATSGSRSTIRGRSLLLAGEVALSMVLVSSAAIVVAVYREQARTELGFDKRGVLTGSLTLDAMHSDAPGSVALVERLAERLRTLPGVETVGVTRYGPFSKGFAMVSVSVVGEPPGRTLAVHQQSDEHYLAAMKLSLGAGRWLSRADGTSRASVVVTERFASRYIKNRPPLGAVVVIDGDEREVVGVVRDYRLLGVQGEPKAEVFTHFATAGAPLDRVTFAVRTQQEPRALIGAFRQVMFEEVPDLPVEELRSLAAAFAADTSYSRAYSTLLQVLALTAICVCIVGVYGVVSFGVAQERRKFGIQLCLGASRRQIVASVFKRGMALVGGGIAMGLFGSVAMERFVEHLGWEEVGQYASLPKYTVAAAILLAATAVACALPAIRAARTHPMVVLRQ